MTHCYVVIMAGGIGTRFWPYSRNNHPKQFHDVLGTGKSLLQMTFHRFRDIIAAENIYVVTSELYQDLTRKQLPELSEHQILLEPNRRNTAPCIAYASYKIRQKDPDACIVVTPSDHAIFNLEAFRYSITQATEHARHSNKLLTIGIEPHRPETGYGYIQYHDHDTNEVKKVKTFTEKPNLEIAKSFLDSGDFLWNSGIFIWSLKSIMDAFKRDLNDVDSLFAEGIGIYNTSGESGFIEKTYAVCKKISIDYGIMEKADNVYVLAVDFGWSDLGTWGSLYDIRNKDKHDNAVMGDNVMLYDTKNCIVNVAKEKLVVIQGLNDFIVVEDNDILLICRKKDEQHIRQFVADVKLEKGPQYI